MRKPRRAPAGSCLERVRAERDRKRFVDLQTDTTMADLAVSAREGYELIEHVKRYTTLGMGTDQGRTGAVNGIGALAEILDKPVSEIGTTTFRQPYTPGHLRRYGGPGSGRALRPCPEDGDARLARRSRGEVRGRRPMEASLVLPPARRVDARRGQ